MNAAFLAIAAAAYLGVVYMVVLAALDMMSAVADWFADRRTR